MRVSRPAILVGVIAAACGWFVRGIDFAAEPAPVTAPAITRAASPSADVEPPLRVEHPQRAMRTERIERNLFAYVTHERRAPATVAVAEPPPLLVAAVEPPPPRVGEERPRLRFPYRYIGNFGTRDRSIAAFVRNGEIRTVIAGGRIDEQFVLRSINIDTVDVEAGDETQRIALD